MCHETCPHPISGGAHLQEQQHTLPVENGSLPLFVVIPEHTPAPAVLIVHDIHGPGPFYQDLARRLADAGYIAALPDFYFRQGPVPEGDRDAARERGAQVVLDKTLGDIRASLAWLRDLGASTGKLATIGMCWGGSMVMLAASRTPAPDASIPFYGFPVRDRTPNNPRLALDEDEVTGINSPMLGFWGDQDTAVGMDNVAAYDDKLTKYGKPHEFVIYPGLGHAFLTFDPDSPAYEDSQDAWQRTLIFLNDHLASA